MLYGSHNKEPQKSIDNYFGPHVSPKLLHLAPGTHGNPVLNSDPKALKPQTPT